MNTELMFSSATDLWETPQALFDELNAKYHFTCDVCANGDNTKVRKNWYSEEIDGLEQYWEGVCWMNPPYGRTIGKWIAKAYRAAVDNKATVVCLLPARTDTKWFHDYCTKGKIEFLKGRLKFGGHINSAPFPSMVVVFSPL